MKKSGQFHAPVALPPVKSRVPIWYEAGWASEPVWTLWRREKSHPYRESNTGHTASSRTGLYYTDSISTTKHWKIWERGDLIRLLAYRNYNPCQQSRALHTLLQPSTREYFGNLIDKFSEEKLKTICIKMIYNSVIKTTKYEVIIHTANIVQYFTV
jgi:hypothetical protein